MKFYIQRHDFNLIIEIDEKKIKNIKDDFYVIPWIYYDSMKNKIVYDKKDLPHIARLYKDVLIGCEELNKDEQPTDALNRLLKWIEEQKINLDAECEKYYQKIIASEKNISASDPDMLEKIKKIRFEIQEKNRKEAEQREREAEERRQKKEAEERATFLQKFKTEHHLDGDDLRNFVYPAVSDEVFVPLKTKGSLFALGKIELDDGFHIKRVWISKKRTYTDNMRSYLNSMIEEFCKVNKLEYKEN